MFDFFSNLLGVLAQFAAELEQIFVFLLNLIVQVFQFVWNVLVNVFDFLYKIGTVAGKFIVHIWNNFFKVLWGRILELFRKVHAFLEAKLGPIVRYLQKVRAMWDRNFQLYIKPILNMLQKIRQGLFVLRLLHIKFAQELDAKILSIESKLTKNFLQLRGVLTTMIDAVNAVIDAPLLVRKPTQVLAFRRVFLSLIRVVTGFPVSYFFPSPRSNAKKGVKTPPAGKSYLDPQFNPPASSYLSGNDGLGDFAGFTSGITPDDTVVDDLEVLDYFNDDLYDIPKCTDIVQCLTDATQSAVGGRFVVGATS
jgi:hypothetical protein